MRINRDLRPLRHLLVQRFHFLDEITNSEKGCKNSLITCFDLKRKVLAQNSYIHKSIVFCAFQNSIHEFIRNKIGCHRYGWHLVE